LETSLNDFLRGNFKNFLNARNPLNPEILLKLPYFTDVFGKDEELCGTLALLSNSDGHPYLSQKNLKPGEVIIKKGDFSNTIYWLLQGHMEVIKVLGGKPVLVARYKDEGQCFGELSVINGVPRSADVRAAKDGAAILEIDWSVTSLCRELDAKFHKLLSRAACEKLDDSYKAFDIALEIIRESKGFDNRYKNPETTEPNYNDAGRE
jgi:hypothetical protein